MTNMPKGPDYAEAIIAKLERGKKSDAQRRAVARMCIHAGNYTDEAKDVFAQYLERKSITA